MKAFSPIIKNSYRRLSLPTPVPVRFFAQNKGGAPPKGGNFPQQGNKPNQKPQQSQPQQQQRPQQNQQQKPQQQQAPKPQQQQQPKPQQPAQQPKSNVPSQAAQNVPLVPLTPEAAKKDLISVFSKELEEIKKDEQKTALANEIKEYLDQSGFKVEENDEGAYVLKKADNNFKVEVVFEAMAKEGEGEEDFGNEDEMERDFSEEADEDESSGQDKIAFSATVHILDKATQIPKGSLMAQGFVGSDARLYVESAVVSDSVQKEDRNIDNPLLDMARPPSGPIVDFQALPQITQDKMYDFFDSLGIDDGMASFMKAYTTEYVAVKNQIEFYEKFKNLLS